MNYFLLELFLGIGVMLLPFLGVVIWRKMPVFHGIGVILLGIYLGMVWNITGLPTIQTFHLEVQGGVSMIPFQDFSAFGCIANVIMVMPLGFLLPLLWENYRKLWKTALAGFSLSLCIEILQLFTFRATDVDDLLMNTLGGIVGYGCYLLAVRLFSSWKDIWCGRISRKQEKTGSYPGISACGAYTVCCLSSYLQWCFCIIIVDCEKIFYYRFFYFFFLTDKSDFSGSKAKVQGEFDQFSPLELF